MQISANFTSDFSPVKYAETNIKKSAWPLGRPKKLLFYFPPRQKNAYLAICGRVFESAKYGQVGDP